MLSPNKKRARLNELLRERIALILLQKTSDPRLQQLTITGVEISSDLRRAKVYYLQRGQEEEDLVTSRALRKATGFIKQELAAEHILRLMPDLTFHYDQFSRQAERLGQLLHLGAGSDREPSESL